MKIHNNISYKVWVGAKKLCIRFNKVDGSRVYNENRSLILFGLEKKDDTS